jgi:hypothetical protein
MYVRSSYFILFNWIWYPVDCNWRCRHISKSIITCISNFEALYFFILPQRFFISRIVKCPGSVVVAVCSSLMSMQILSNSPPNSHVQNHFTQRFLMQSKSYGHIMLMRCGCCRPYEDRMELCKKKRGDVSVIRTRRVFFIWFWWVFSKVH